MRAWVIIGHDGAHRYVSRARGSTPPRWDKAAERRPISIPHLPADGELWDADHGAFVRDEAIAADMQVAHWHKDQAHLIKQVEASLILSGYALNHGLIAEEAAATGATAMAIAEAVHARTADFRLAESGRRKAKVKGRKQ